MRWMMRGELRGLGLVSGLFPWGFFWLGPRRPPRKAHASTCVYVSPGGVRWSQLSSVSSGWAHLSD